MKAQTNPKSGHSAAHAAIERAVVLRSSAAKTFEHRYARRKNREQLRRLGVFSGEDEIFA